MTRLKNDNVQFSGLRNRSRMFALPSWRSVMTDHQERDAKRVAVTQHVADEGNVPGRPSTSAALMIAFILLIGLGLMHLTSLYGPSHVVRSQLQSSAQ